MARGMVPGDGRGREAQAWPVRAGGGGYGEQSGKSLTQLVHRLRGHAARKQLGALPDAFIAEAQPIADDVKALRRMVQCPAATS
jgi:hypothetical protein